MRRLIANDGSLLGDMPQTTGSWYERTPDSSIHYPASRGKKKRKKRKLKRNIRKRDYSLIDAVGNRKENYNHSRIHKERPGDSGQHISGTVPMGWNQMNIGRTSDGGPGHGFYHGNVSPDRAQQWNVYVNSSTVKRIKVFAMEEENLKIIQRLDQKWNSIIDPSKDMLTFSYQKLAYLFQEIMYSVTQLIKQEGFSEQDLVDFTYYWLYDNAIVRQSLKQLGMGFTEMKTYESLISGLYNLRDSLSGVEEYDHSFNTNLRNQRSFY